LKSFKRGLMKAAIAAGERSRLHVCTWTDYWDFVRNTFSPCSRLLWGNS